MEFKYRTALPGLLVALAFAGCAGINLKPLGVFLKALKGQGQIERNYEQSGTLVSSASVSSVTVVRLTDEVHRRMAAGEFVRVGHSQFETDHFDRAQIEAEAKAHAKKIGANVVILSAPKVRTETRTRQKTVRTPSSSKESHSWIDDKGTQHTRTKTKSSDGTSFERGRSSSSTTSNTWVDEKGTQHTRTKTKSSSFTIGGPSFGTGGGTKTVEEQYDVDIYKVRVAFVRNPAYPGLQ